VGQQKNPENIFLFAISVEQFSVIPADIKERNAQNARMDF